MKYPKFPFVKPTTHTHGAHYAPYWKKSNYDMAVVQISHFTQELPVMLLGFRSLGSSRALQVRKREGRCWYYCTRSPLKASGLCLRRKVKGNISLFVYSIDSRCVRHSDFITISEKLNLIRWYIDRQTAWKQMGEIWKKRGQINEKGVR